MPNIKLKSFDGGEILEVDIKIAKMSKLIHEMLENLACSKDEDDVDVDVILISNVTSPILKKVMEWAEHHKDDSPLPDDDDEKVMLDKLTGTGWDAVFLNVVASTVGDYATKKLSETREAANYLDIKELLDLATAKLSLMMSSCPSTTEIRNTFGIPNNAFSAEEELFVHQQNEWCTLFIKK